MKKYLFQMVNLAAVLGLTGYLVFGSHRERSAFILNQRVFNSFDGKIELEKELKAIEEENAKILDSLVRLPVNENSMLAYEREKMKLDLRVRQLSEKFTADAWKRINEYVISYGEQNGYDYIFGASGDGSLMYARNGNDVTDEVIEYVNQKYNGND